MRRLLIMLLVLSLPAVAQVRTGIDVLESRDFDVLAPNPGAPVRLGLVTNQTGRDRRGRRTIDVLAAAPGLRLAAIFTPEHGLTGDVDTTDIPHTTDPATGLPVYSVYGATDASRRPDPRLIRSLDVIVFDLQEVGIRFYTYASTLGHFLEAAAAAGKPIVVLDRPNPITGTHVEGTPSDPGLCLTEACRFVNYHPLPVRHGMTIGELARLFNGERALHADLTVVPVEGWHRRDWFDQAGQPWISPSPNLPTLQAATLYGGVALLEKTNLSVGRGTSSPFALVGAPWISAPRLAAYLNRRRIAGVRFSPATFTPDASRYSGELCHGVRLQLTQRDRLDVAELGLELAAALHHLYPVDFQLSAARELLSDDHLLAAMERGADPRRLAAGWQPALQEFRRRRALYLLY